VGTPRLNKWLASISAAKALLSKTGKRFKIRYMTQKDVLPPTFVLFTNTQASFAPAYEKYFVKEIRDAFDLRDTPIKLVLKSPSKK
jgi:GTP-binding protein